MRLEQINQRRIQGQPHLVEGKVGLDAISKGEGVSLREHRSVAPMQPQSDRDAARFARSRRDELEHAVFSETVQRHWAPVESDGGDEHKVHACPSPASLTSVRAKHTSHRAAAQQRATGAAPFRPKPHRERATCHRRGGGARPHRVSVQRGFLQE